MLKSFIEKICLEKKFIKTFVLFMKFKIMTNIYCRDDNSYFIGKFFKKRIRTMNDIHPLAFKLWITIRMWLS